MWFVVDENALQPNWIYKALRSGKKCFGFPSSSNFQAKDVSIQYVASKTIQSS
jgi:hypothetical protein